MPTEFQSLLSVIKNLSTAEPLLAKCLLANELTVRNFINTRIMSFHYISLYSPQSIDLCIHKPYIIGIVTHEGTSALGVRRQIKGKMLFHVLYILKYLYALFCGS